MAIVLFKHNQDAYIAALQMLQTTGKAVMIHPTGPENPWNAKLRLVQQYYEAHGHHQFAY